MRSQYLSAKLNFGSSKYDGKVEPNNWPKDQCECTPKRESDNAKSRHFYFGVIPSIDTTNQQNNYLVSSRPLSNLKQKINVLELPLESWAFTKQQIFAAINDYEATVHFSLSFIQSLSDPRPFLLSIRDLSRQTNTKIYLKNVESHLGFRHWNQEQVSHLLSAVGLKASITEKQIECISLEFSEELLEQSATSLGLDISITKSRTLILTTENADVFPTGGIGTYVQNRLRTDPSTTALMLDLGRRKFRSAGRCANLDDINGKAEKYIDNFEISFDFLEAIKNVLFLLPDLVKIEYQDYLSIGFRIVQAKKTAQFPQDIQLVLQLLGSIDYIKYGDRFETLPKYSIDEARHAIMDSYVAKYSDEAHSPTLNYSQTLIDQFGYQINNLRISRLPFETERQPHKVENFESIKQVVYLGKYSSLKGWPDFVNALLGIREELIERGIERVVSLAPGEPPSVDLKRLKSSFSFKSYFLSAEKFKNFLKENLNDSLFVLPSRGESYSYIVQQLALLGARFVTYNAAAIPETLSYIKLPDYYLCDPQPGQLSNAIISHLDRTPLEALELGTVMATIAHQIQRSANLASTTIEWQQDAGQVPWSKKEITVVTPVFNTEIQYVQQLAESLENSSIRPYEWIIVNDGSTQEYSERLEREIHSANFTFGVRILNQANLGLAAARNAGLRNASTTHVFVMDSDDLFLPTTLEASLAAMCVDPSLTSAVGYSVIFGSKGSVGKNPISAGAGETWKPIGIPEARSISLHRNEFIPASTLVNREKLSDSMLWDSSGKETWEDWSFYSRLAWSGNNFALIPTPGYLYRDSDNSMSKKYSKYMGHLRLSRNLPPFNKLDARVILSLSNFGAGPAVSNYESGKVLPTLLPEQVFWISLISSPLFMPIIRMHKILARFIPMRLKTKVSKLIP